VSAESLRDALASLGLRGDVEGVGLLAVLTLARDVPLDAHTRAEAVTMAARHGFTHLALELPAGRDTRAALHRP
jgi:hypothetical protein